MDPKRMCSPPATSVGIRTQQLVERPDLLGVSYDGRDFGQQRHHRQPLRVPLHGAEVVPGQSFEPGLCLWLLPLFAIEPSEQRRVDLLVRSIGLQAF